MSKVKHLPADRRLPQWLGLVGVAVLLMGALAVQGCRARSGDEDEKPDIIVLLVDSLRADYLGCYGFRGDISPSLDRLAAESIVYDNAVAPAPWTKPSVASLFTSLDPITHRVVDHFEHFANELPASEKTDALAKEAWTLAEDLGDLGYETAAWVANNWLEDPGYGFNQGFGEFHAVAGRNANRILPEVRKWLERPAADPRDVRPRFVYAHFMDVHGPYQSTPELVTRFASSPSLGEDRLLTPKERAAVSYLADFSPWRDSETGNHLRTWRAAYASGVRLFDDRLGPFLEWLRTSERGKRTILVFTSDHGEDLLEHGRWNHGYSPTLFQHSIRIPLMVRLPGASGGGRRDDRMTSLVDLMPTLLRLAGRPAVPDTLEGRVLLDRSGRAAAGGPAWAFSGAVADDPYSFSIQDRDYKLIWKFPQDAMALYDLRRDPAEKTNLASLAPGARDPSVEEVRRTMTQALADRIERLRARPTLLQAPAGLSPDAVKQLRALGYLQ